MEINIPEVVEELKAVWLRYQKAVDEHDAEVMNELFWNSPTTVRFGHNGTLIGYDAIASFRLAGVGHDVVYRELHNAVITTFGRDFATTSTEKRRKDNSVIGRQSQCWIRTPDGWRIASAHVSDQP